MPIPNISLAQFSDISSGEYNAGHVDFATDANGNRTGGLTKVNNHVHRKGLNKVQINPQRAVEMKEAFIKALSDGGVTPERIQQIRARLGISADTKSSLADASAALEKRFQPLTRQEVREIIRNDSGLAQAQGAAPAESRKVREKREAVNNQIATLVRKSPPHEQLFTLLSGRSCMDSTTAALRSSPDIMKIAAGLRLNARDTLLLDAWNRLVNLCLDRAGRTLAVLRAAISDFAANPETGPKSVKTPFGTITLSFSGAGAMREPLMQASLHLGDETLTLDLGGTAAEIVARLDTQISGGAETLGLNRLGSMLSYAKRHDAIAPDSDPCLGRTVAQTILRNFANVSQSFLDELDNRSLERYAREVAKGENDWTEDTIRSARNEVLRNPDNVRTIARITEEIGENVDENEENIIQIISNEANEAANEIVNGGGNGEKIEEEPKNQEPGPQPGGVQPPPQQVQPPPQEIQPPPQEQIQPPPQEQVQPPQMDKFEKLFGAPLQKDAEDVVHPGRKIGVERNPRDDRLSSVEAGDGEMPAHFKSALDSHRRAEERRVFNELTLLFERPKDAPADDKASSVKTGPAEEKKHFLAAQRTQNFTFAAANLGQPERKAIGDFAWNLVKYAAMGDTAALKALVAQNLHSLIRMAADPAGAAAFFPPELVADAKGLVSSLALELETAAKAGTGRTIDFRSFTLGDEDALKAVFGRVKNQQAADAVADAFLRVLRESVKATSPDTLKAAGAAIGDASVDALAAFAKKDPLALAAFAFGDGKISGRNAAQTAELKAAVLKTFKEATGRETLADATLAEFDAFAKKCADGSFDKTFAAIGARNELIETDLYREVAGSKGKLQAAGAAQKDLGAVQKAPQTSELSKADIARGDVVGGISLHISDMLDSDAPHPSSATAADMRGLAADLFETAEKVIAKGANVSPSALRDVMLKDIDAFCRFMDNPRALSNAVMPAIRDLVAGTMADVRSILATALEAALGKKIREIRPVEIKHFLQQLDPKNPDAVATMNKIASAFANLVDDSAKSLQGYVNDICHLDPKAVIASEYDKMKPEEIEGSLSKKSLDDILDDPLTNSSRPGILAFQKKVISTYFTTVSHTRKSEVLSSALRNAPNIAGNAGDIATNTKFLSAIFLGAGPLMQKTLQGIDRRVMGPYGGAVDVLKSSIPPIPDAYVTEKLNQIVEENSNRYSVLMTIDQKPFVTLGAATVGQAVKCKLMNTNGEPEDVIVKILRPGAKAGFDEDVKIFDAVAKTIPSVKKIWDARVATIESEFDFSIEAKNIAIGQVYEVHDNRYVMVTDKKTGQKVPKVNPKTGKRVHTPGCEDTWTVSAMKTPQGVKQKKDVLIGSVAPGEPLDKILATQTRAIHSLFAGVFETDAEGRIVRRNGKPVVRKDMSIAGFFAIHNNIHQSVKDISQSGLYFRQVIWKWLEEALFKSGVMHNDVHTGNLMLDLDTQRATFIDFGNLVQLSQDDRISLLKLVASVAAKHTDYFIAAFGELLAKTKEEKSAFKTLSEKGGKFHAVVHEVIHKGLAASDTGYRFQALLSELQKLGVDIPPQIGAFVEGLTRLQNCHEELADLLNDTQNLYHAYQEQIINGPELAKREPDDVIGKLLDVMAKPGALNASKNLDGQRQLDKEIYNARNDVMDLAWKGMNGTLKGSLVDKIRAAVEAERGLPGNDKLTHLVSLVSRHAFPDDAARIEETLARFIDVKRRIRSAESSGASNRAAQLRVQLDSILNSLLENIREAVEVIQRAIDTAKEAQPPDEKDFHTESAASIFASIVTENFDVVKKAFSGFWGAGKIGVAFKRAREDDKNHQTDGHRKLNTGKL